MTSEFDSTTTKETLYIYVSRYLKGQLYIRYLYSDFVSRHFLMIVFLTFQERLCQLLLATTTQVSNEVGSELPSI